MLPDVMSRSQSACLSHPHIPILGYFPSLWKNSQLSVGNFLKAIVTDVTAHWLRNFEQCLLLALWG